MRAVIYTRFSPIYIFKYSTINVKKKFKFINKFITFLVIKLLNLRFQSKLNLNTVLHFKLCLGKLKFTPRNVRHISINDIFLLRFYIFILSSIFNSPKYHRCIVLKLLSECNVACNAYIRYLQVILFYKFADPCRFWRKWLYN